MKLPELRGQTEVRKIVWTTDWNSVADVLYRKSKREYKQDKSKFPCTIIEQNKLEQEMTSFIKVT